MVPLRWCGRMHLLLKVIRLEQELYFTYIFEIRVLCRLHCDEGNPRYKDKKKINVVPYLITMWKLSSSHKKSNCYYHRLHIFNLKLVYTTQNRITLNFEMLLSQVISQFLIKQQVCRIQFFGLIIHRVRLLSTS